MTRSRTCTNPTPAFGGDDCRGHDIDYELCNQEIRCARDCTWAGWNEWGHCSTSCGPGTRERNRVKAIEEIGGGTCLGSPTESEHCQFRYCEYSKLFRKHCYPD